MFKGKKLQYREIAALLRRDNPSAAVHIWALIQLALQACDVYHD